jgi:hypothetical protein
MSSSSTVGNGAHGRGIVRRRGERGGRLRPRLHYHREITLPMGDPRRVANVVI